jgi:hypothetical protein
VKFLTGGNQPQAESPRARLWADPVQFRGRQYSLDERRRFYVVRYRPEVFSISGFFLCTKSFMKEVQSNFERGYLQNEYGSEIMYNGYIDSPVGCFVFSDSFSLFPCSGTSSGV